MKLAIRSVTLCLGASLLAFSSTASAQRTIIVDGNNGPGAHFTDLPIAVASANDGDKIVIRPFNGIYDPGFVIDGKSLSIEGASGVMVNTVVSGPTIIRNLPSGKVVSIRNMAHFGPSLLGHGPIEVSNCAGVVELDHVGTRNDAWRMPYLRISNCACVTLRYSHFHTSPVFGFAAPALWTTNSNVNVENCTIGGVHSPYSISQGTEAVVALGCHINFVASVLEGGSDPTSGKSALDATNCTSTIAGGSALNSLRGNAIRATGGTVTYDPQTAFTGPIIGSARFTVVPVAAMQCAASVGSLTTTLKYLPNHLCALWLSLPNAPVTTTFGDRWVDVATMLPADTGFCDIWGYRATQFTVPRTPELVNLLVVFQSLVVTPSNGVERSTPTFVTLQ